MGPNCVLVPCAFRQVRGLPLGHQPFGRSQPKDATLPRRESWSNGLESRLPSARRGSAPRSSPGACAEFVSEVRMTHSTRGITQIAMGTVTNAVWLGDRE